VQDINLYSSTSRCVTKHCFADSSQDRALEDVTFQRFQRSRNLSRHVFFSSFTDNTCNRVITIVFYFALIHDNRLDRNTLW